MEAVHSHLKFIKFRTPEELHEDSNLCISELLFIRDELDFLSELIKEYTIDLISREHFESSKEIAEKIIQIKKELKPLLLKVKGHKNLLDKLVDGVDLPNELEEYKEDHYKLMFEAVALNAKFKSLKKQIFILIKQSMKINKSKRLLK